jgi:hypothetical protein
MRITGRVAALYDATRLRTLPSDIAGADGELLLAGW